MTHRVCVFISVHSLLVIHLSHCMLVLHNSYHFSNCIIFSFFKKKVQYIYVYEQGMLCKNINKPNKLCLKYKLKNLNKKR